MNDGETGAKQAGADEAEQRTEPELVIEQPEGGVGLGPAEMARETHEDQKRAKKERLKEPDFPREPEQEPDDENAGKPERDACRKRAPLRLHIEIDGDDPEERRSEGADDPVFEVAGGVVIEFIGGEDAGEDQRERKTRRRGAQVRKPVSPPRPGRRLAHCRFPRAVSLSARLSCARAA